MNQNEALRVPKFPASSECHHLGGPEGVSSFTLGSSILSIRATLDGQRRSHQDRLQPSHVPVQYTFFGEKS